MVQLSGSYIQPFIILKGNFFYKHHKPVNESRNAIITYRMENSVELLLEIVLHLKSHITKKPFLDLETRRSVEQ